MFMKKIELKLNKYFRKNSSKISIRVLYLQQFKIKMYKLPNMHDATLTDVFCYKNFYKQHFSIS